MTRNTSTLAAALAVLAFSLPAYAADPIKIGVLLPSSGVFAGLGADQTLALEMGFDDFGREVGGRPIELIPADTESKPNSGLAQFKKLVFKDEVDIVVGIISSAVAGAVRDTAHNAKVPLIISNAGNNPLTGEQCSPWIPAHFVLELPDRSGDGAVDGGEGLQQRLPHGLRLRGRSPDDGCLPGRLRGRGRQHRRRGVPATGRDQGLRPLPRQGEGGQAGRGLRVLRRRPRDQVRQGVGGLRAQGRSDARRGGLAELRALREEAGDGRRGRARES